MKKSAVVILIFLYGCGDAATEANIATSAVHLDASPTESKASVNKFDISKLVGKYNYYKEKVIGGYKISGDYDLTLRKDFSYKMFITNMDEYNDNQLNYKSYEGRFNYDDYNTIKFFEGDFGGRGGKIYLSESNLNGNLDQITVTFSSGRGDPMYFHRIIERKPIFTAENVKQPTSSSSIDKSVASIIGKPFKISNLEVVQKDFPNVMNWNDAKEACAELGDGWRLPTKDELNILYNNKDKIGGFASVAYWSSSEREDTSAWLQYFGNGVQNYTNKTVTFYVRAVRAF